MSLLARTVAAIRPPDEAVMRAARERQDSLTKPPGSLGRLEELAVKVAGITGQVKPRLNRMAVFVMAADHGVVEEGVSLYPQEVTVQMVANFLQGGAGINVLARHVGARVIVMDVGVKGETRALRKKIAPGTANMARGPAMTREQAVAAVEAGIQVVEAELAAGLDLAATGDMGIGNTTASSAVCAALTGEPVEAVTGRGTGLDDAGLAHKRAVIARALEVNRPDPRDPLDVLAKVGGFEIGAIAGVILACAARRIPVVIDGFISGAGALVAKGLAPLSREYMFAGHLSAEPGHALLLKHLGLEPLLNLNMRLGEGTGACLGMSLVAAACKIQSEMATFAEAGVSQAEER